MKTTPLVLLASVIGFHTLLSQSTTWNGGGANDNWSTAENWTSGVPSNAGSVVVSLAGSTRLNPVVDANWSISRLVFLSGASSFDVGGSHVLTLTSTAGTTSGALVNSSSVLQTVSTDLRLGAAANSTVTFYANSGDLLFTGDIDVSNQRLLLNGLNGRSITVSGNISGAGGNLAAINTGVEGFTLTLSGSNSFTGGAAFLRGTVYLKSNAALGAASTVNLGTGGNNSNASLLMAGAYSTARNIVALSPNSGASNNSVTLGGSTADASVFSGNITLGNSDNRGRMLFLTAAENGRVTISGNILGYGTDSLDGITKVGLGTVILSGENNSYKGSTIVNAGTLLLNGTFVDAGGAITVNEGARLGGTSWIDRVVDIAGGGILLGGDGTLDATLTINADVNFAEDSLISLALGEAGAHSTLARAGGSWSFDDDQGFLFLDLGAQPGVYYDILTDLEGLSQNVVDQWTIANPGWVGSFVYDGGNVNLHLSAVPEPSTVMFLGCGAALVGWMVRRRVRRN